MQEHDSPHAAGKTERPQWDSVVLICKQCRKRKNGPDELKPKTLSKTVRAYLKGRRPRPRVVLTSCLGLCPKQATAVAFVGNDREPAIVGVESLGQMEAALARLAG